MSQTPHPLTFHVAHSNPITIRVGLPETTGKIASAAYHLRQPILISAGALWDPSREHFRPPGMTVIRMQNRSLDSAGFTRGKGGAYPWTVEQYADLGCTWGWDWWSQMDLCCEEAIAPDRAAVIQRVKDSAALYLECAAAARRHLGKTIGAQAPTAVLQGRLPEDYERSADLLATACGGNLPAFLGVGSMCTRPVGGREGLIPILEHLARILPAQVKLHLFGVKGAALRYLHAFPQVVSVDSMAWDFRARVLWREGKRLGKTLTEHRIMVMKGWLLAQLHMSSGADPASTEEREAHRFDDA